MSDKRSDDGNLAATPNTSERMGGLSKGLAVIDAFRSSPGGMTISDVAKKAGLDRSTTRRCLFTLVDDGYAKMQGRLFSLTPQVLRLSGGYLGSPLLRILQPSLDHLALALHQSCSATVLDGAEVVYIARANRHRVGAAELDAGSRLPAYCTAMGRCLLAAKSDKDAREVLESIDRVAINPKTITDIETLMELIAAARSNDYSIIDQEILLGFRTIAVPIRNSAGATVCAISVAVHATSASFEQLVSDYLPEMRKVQEDLATFLN